MSAGRLTTSRIAGPWVDKRLGVQVMDRASASANAVSEDAGLPPGNGGSIELKARRERIGPTTWAARSSGSDVRKPVVLR